MLNKKTCSIIFLIILFILSVLFLVPHNKHYKVIDVISPTEFILSGRKSFTLKDYDTFDSFYSEKNKKLAHIFNISENEAFLLGNIAKNDVKNYMIGRNVYINKQSDLISNRKSYKIKFYYSGYCIKDSKHCTEENFNQKLNALRKTEYKIIDTDSSKIYNANSSEVRNLKNFIVIRKSHIPKNFNTNKNTKVQKIGLFDNIKIFLSDSNSKYFPDKNCSSDICKELLHNINKANHSIDIAIYGYSRIPKIESALIQAKTRGVNIRLVYDLDSKGENIYPDTDKLISIIKNSTSDGKSSESGSIMHNKFYIFDDEIVVTGSANLSSTDMSEFNSNSALSIKSKEVAKLYKQEFEQMFNGKFHSVKESIRKEKIILNNSKLDIYFSPQDKSIENGILPIIKNAKNYIYIPIFFLTDKRIAAELINAKSRSVDVKIIVDAVSASSKHSKHKELRNYNIPVKVENYAGKMHSKSMIVDDIFTIIGSMNFSNSGENKNDENLIIIENKGIAKFYKNFFLYQWNRIDNRYLNFDIRAEGPESIGSCFDGIDNNYDGFIDSEDEACKKISRI